MKKATEIPFRVAASATIERPKKGTPSLAAFASLALSAPQAWDGAEMWRADGPFSPLLDPARIGQAIENAKSLEELADIGVQALNPGPRRARGDSIECCMIAWRLWAMVEWTVAAAPDALRAQLPKDMDGKPRNGGQSGKSVEIVDPAQFGLLQWKVAKALLKALATPSDFEGLANGLAQFHAKMEIELQAWAEAHAPALIETVWMDTRDRIVLNRADGEVAEVGQANWRLRPLANAVMGQELATICAEPLQEPAARSEKEFKSHCANQRYFWRQESVIAAEWRMTADQGVDERGQKLIDSRLPPEGQTVGAVGAALANAFGLRSVAIHPVGGAQRAKQELVRAFCAFSSLSEVTGLPEKALGLGGTKLSVAAAFWASGRSDGVQAYFAWGTGGGADQEKCGNLVFTAPMSGLAHEWTHAWDMPWNSLTHKALPKGALEALNQARENLRKTARFEEPVSAATARTYWRGKERPVKAWMWDIFVYNDGAIFESLKARGTEEAKARAEIKRLPLKMPRQLKAVWAAIEEGSEKQIREKVLIAAKNFRVLTVDEEAPEKWALETARLLSIHRQELRDRRLDMKKAINEGPMRWEAGFRDKGADAPYWTAPHEMLARSAEKFAADKGGVGTLSLAEKMDFMCPFGEEAARSNTAFEDFFVAARPLFEAFAKKSEARGVASPITPEALATHERPETIISKAAFAQNWTPKIDLRTRLSEKPHAKIPVESTVSEPPRRKPRA